jgi:hypothetical protein
LGFSNWEQIFCNQGKFYLFNYLFSRFFYSGVTVHTAKWTEVKSEKRHGKQHQFELYEIFKASFHPQLFLQGKEMERERNPSIRTPAKHAKVHENLIPKARFSRSLAFSEDDGKDNGERKEKLNLFLDYSAASRLLF